jgi:hypothetical protein
LLILQKSKEKKEEEEKEEEKKDEMYVLHKTGHPTIMCAHI